jgi:regulation of enolase protein 1 (concanavalin A-like superfamily)
MKKKLLAVSLLSIPMISLAQSHEYESFDRGINSQWKIIDENNHQWKIQSGKLQMQVQPVNIWADLSLNANNLFVHPVDSNNYSTEVSVELNPKNTYEQAGIGIFWDSDNYIKITNEMFNEKHSLVFVTEENGVPKVNKYLPLDNEYVRFKLERNEKSVIASYKLSEDSLWRNILSVPVISGVESGVFLFTFSGGAKNQQWAKFDDFSINLEEK